MPPNFGLWYRHDRAKAVEILVNDLKVFSTFNEELYKEITQLLTLDNFRCFKKFHILCEITTITTTTQQKPLVPTKLG
jgi:uncharacterized protein (DUF2235 family)